MGVKLKMEKSKFQRFYCMTSKWDVKQLNINRAFGQQTHSSILVTKITLRRRKLLKMRRVAADILRLTTTIIEANECKTNSEYAEELNVENSTIIRRFHFIAKIKKLNLSENKKNAITKSALPFVCVTKTKHFLITLWRANRFCTITDCK